MDVLLNPWDLKINSTSYPEDFAFTHRLQGGLDFMERMPEKHRMSP